LEHGGGTCLVFVKLYIFHVAFDGGGAVGNVNKNQLAAGSQNRMAYGWMLAGSFPHCQGNFCRGIIFCSFLIFTVDNFFLCSIFSVMKNDLFFSRNEMNFQFRLLENGNIKWRSWEDGATPDETERLKLDAQHEYFFASLYPVGRESVRILQDLQSYGRFSQRDRNKIVKWFLS
jgi:hypothetical protein